jgi:beta-galactosidase
MATGVCYFPEHWPRERWAEQVAAMAEAGLSVVRMGEFAWSRLEPRRGELDLDWLSEAVDLVAEHGMDAVLCTPTATPPKWLVDDRPSILRESRDGTVQEHGSRRHYCFNSTAYREETERIVTAVADRFADHPAVIGWQTDNEYGCHETVRCYCADCASAFRTWLQERYGSIEQLNEAWGTTFWSQHYDAFAEIDPPGPTPAEHHPSRLLDYARFANDSVVEYNRLQTELLREIDDEWFVTHNFMGDFRTLDAAPIAADLDHATWDSYPTGFVQDRRPGEPSAAELRAGDPDQVGLNHDLYEAIAPGSFWVMEQQPGDVNWPPYAPQPADGAVRLWTHQAIAHGADLVSYFRWQRCREGQEQYHAGLRHADGTADRGYHEAARVAEELDETLPELAPASADVALVHDHDALWAIDEQRHAPTFEYWSYLRTYYTALRARGLQVDVIPPEAFTSSFSAKRTVAAGGVPFEAVDASEYDAIVAPALHLVDEELVDAIEDVVNAGTTLLLGARSGVKTPSNQLHARQPGPLADLAGLTVERHESLPDQLETTLTYEETSYEYRTWAEWLQPEEASAVATYTSGPAEDSPAITINETSGGNVLYSGGWPEPALADAIVTEALDRAGLDYAKRAPDGVRVLSRDGHTWLLNFTEQRVSVDNIDQEAWVIGSRTIGSFDVAVARAPATSVVVPQPGGDRTGEG